MRPELQEARSTRGAGGRRQQQSSVGGASPLWLRAPQLALQKSLQNKHAPEGPQSPRRGLVHEGKETFSSGRAPREALCLLNSAIMVVSA